ncbi:MAG TPA: hypothetical protein VLY03_01185 [Bacteroidota bacterium]|nr:hypothetical protein [Bacteroidota bacterium]
MKAVLVVCILLMIAGTAHAQAPGVGLPFSVKFGVFGGVSLPTSDLGTIDNTGWNAGAKLRFSGLMPLNIVVAGTYNRLPNNQGGNSDVIWSGSAGLEYPISMPFVSPYLGIDALVNTLTNTASGAPSNTREGLALGGGADISLPIIGSFDVGVKYQFLNMIGKDTNEKTASQVIGTVAIMLGGV